MIMTSYFANKDLKQVSGKYRLMSIARGSPKWFQGVEFKDLAPSWDLVKVKDPEIYTERYKAEVLSKLDPSKIAQRLDNCILLCWERPGDFCHRRLVAKWIERGTGQEVPEFSIEPPKEKPDDGQLDLFANT